MTRGAYALLLASMICMGTVYTIPNQRAFAHTFSGDESASFLATVEVIKVHLQLVKIDLATNATNSLEHAEHAAEHLDNDTIKEITEKNKRLGTDLPAALKDLQETLEGSNPTAADIDQKVTNINNLLDETITVRIEKTQLSNSTVQGTMFANLVDEILESYNGAYGIEEEGENGSMNMTESNSTGESSNSSMQMSGSDENKTSSEGNDTIVNMVAYEGAQALTVRAQELFDTKLKAMAEANATQAVIDLDAGLKHLKQAIDDKAPHDEVDVIVHSEVHPNIQKSFNLQVIPEFPLPLLLTIPAIAGIIVATRISALRRK
jgi:hypothetical protein